MKTMKRIAACACFASSVFAADAQLDIVVRDFSVEHPDFENFSEEFSTSDADAEGQCGGPCSNKMLNEATAYGYVGFDQAWYDRAALHTSCGNDRSKAGSMIGVDDKPMSINPQLPGYLQQTSAGPVLEYGECSDGTEKPLS